MDKNKFVSLMDKFGVAYITYATPLSPSNKKTSFMVATTDFNDKYIAKIEAKNLVAYGSKHPELEEDEVLVFSYSKNKFQGIKLDKVKAISSLSAEMRKAS